MPAAVLSVALYHWYEPLSAAHTSKVASPTKIALSAGWVVTTGLVQGVETIEYGV